MPTLHPMAYLRLTEYMDQYSLKTAARVSIGLLIVLLAGAVIFYRERMLFVDAPGIAFTIINQKTLAIQEHRYGSFITQMFPLAGTWLHLPVRVILILYSASFNLFYLVTGLLLYRMRAYALVVLLALYFTLFVSDTYFWTNNEVHQGIAWMFLMFGALWYMEEQKVRLWISVPVFIVLTFLAIFTHPLIMLCTGFLWVFMWMEKYHAPFNSKYNKWVYTGILACIVGVKFYLSQQGWYDSNKLHNVTHTTLPKVLATFQSDLADAFWKRCIRNYWLLLLLFAGGLTALVREKRYGTLFWTVSGVLGYFVLICLTYYEWTTFYIESEWMIISIIGTAPFVFYFLPKMKSAVVALLLLAVFGIRLGYIWNSLPVFQNRVAHLQHMLDKMKEKNISKAIVVRKDERLERKLIMAWNTAPETIFLSALDGDVPLRTVIQVYEHELPYKVPNNKRDFMNSFYNITYEQLNHSYFYIDTSQSYQVLTYDDFFND